MITKFKIFEKQEKLKKYILLLTGNKLSIMEIYNSHVNVVGDLAYNFKIVAKLDENGIRRLSQDSGFEVRYIFLIKHMISQSNDLEELIDEMSIKYNSNKYNL